LLIWGNNLVSEMTFDYSDCDTLTPSQSLISPNFTNLPKFSYRLRSSDSNAQIVPPQYAFFANSSNPDVSSQSQCIIQFDVPANLSPSILLYFKLTNFYQNHRRYVKSFDSSQLTGTARTPSQLNSGNCKPVATTNNLPIYPCGLIANSIFNDTFSNLTLLNLSQGASSNYTLSEKGIAWPGEAKKYVSRPGYHDLTQVAPPPNWMRRFPNGYSNSTPPPDLRADEHFQNWMRTAGLPTFTKLYSRNDVDTLVKGRYEIVIGMNFPVRSYKGTKSVVISTVAWIGGKNPFLGWAYIASSAVFVALAILGTIRHLVKPRRLGDMSLLSWNR